MTETSKKIIQEITSEFERVENYLYNRFSKIKTKTDLKEFHNNTFLKFNDLINLKINSLDQNINPNEINEIRSISLEKMNKLKLIYSKLYQEAKNMLPKK